MKRNHQFMTGLTLSAAITLFSINALAEPVTEQFDNGAMNWGSGEMSAVGIGVPPQKYASNPARGRAMAVRAAKVDASRNLLETMQGVRVQSQTLVKDFVAESDLIQTKMQGTVRNAAMVGKPRYMDDGSVEVVMAINYRQSVAKTVIEHYGQKTASASAAAPKAVVSSSAPAVTGLIIDAVGKGLKTALAPRILDEDGNVIYSGSMVAEDKQNDIVAYDTSAADATKLARLGANPLTIKALKVVDKTDIVISNADASKIGKAPGMQSTLRQAHVAFAL